MAPTNSTSPATQPANDTRRSDADHALDLERPEFLDQLDTDSSAAFETFYRFAQHVFAKRPPRIVRGMRIEDREDALHTVVYHCCKNEFRVLRQYSVQGKSFCSWFRTVATRKLIDERTAAGRALDGAIELDTELHGMSNRIEQRIDAEQSIKAVNECIAELDLESQILVVASSSGMTPQQMTKLLGWPESANKKASDKCRYARKKLKKMLEKRGIVV